MPSDSAQRDGESRALDISRQLVEKLTLKKEMLAGAESCTAGLVSDYIARIPGASAVLWGSFVTYTANAKYTMLGVPEDLVEKHGAVSQRVALAMAEGALKKSGAMWAFSVTGLAGPGSDDCGADVGTVWIGISKRDENDRDSFCSDTKKFLFSGTRNEVRRTAAIQVLEELLKKVLTEVDF